MFSTLSKTEINALLNDKILDVTKLKTFTNEKLNVTKLRISLFGRVENITGKGEYAGYQHFLVLPQYFPRVMVLKSQDCVKELSNICHYQIFQFGQVW